MALQSAVGPDVYQALQYKKTGAVPGMGQTSDFANLQAVAGGLSQLSRTGGSKGPVEASLLSPPGLQGVFGAGAGMEEMAGRALGGPVRETQYGLLRNPLTGQVGAMAAGQTVTPQVTSEDVLQSMLEDRKAEMQAASEQRGREEEGHATAKEALTRSTAGVRKTAEDLPDRVASMVREEMGGAHKGVEEIRERSRELPGRAEERERVAQEDSERRMEEGMAEFEDTTAAALQGNRLAENISLQRNLEDITMDYAQRGFDGNSPQVQNAVRKAKEQSASRMGQLAAQMSTSYNATRASLRSSYDTLVTGLRQQGLGREQRADEQEISGLTSAATLDRGLREIAIRERQGAEQMRAQMLTLADQQEWTGNQWLAEWLRDETVFTSPLAPIIAAAYASQTGESESVAAGISVSGAPLPGRGTELPSTHTSNIPEYKRKPPYKATSPYKNGEGPAVDPSPFKPGVRVSA